MAKGYRPVARDQQFLLPPDMRERLPAGSSVGVGVDGRKVAASASKGANGTGEGLRKLAAEAVAAHAAADAAEDEALGPGVRGDEVPAGVASPRSKAAAADRAARIAAALAGLEAGREAAEKEQAERDGATAAYLDELQAGRIPAGNPPAGAEVAAARPQ